jgi:formylglycine-generating enzyme required for sulfatase activity
MLGHPFAVGKFHVTVAQFTAFVFETRHDTGLVCTTFEEGMISERQNRSWRSPGFAQDDLHPAVCLNWNDAKAYVNWLALKTGKPYRLLTEAEWEYSARAPKSQPYPRYSFGDDEKKICDYGNVADQRAKSRIFELPSTVADCDDHFAHTSPVGTYAPNGFQLYDMQGNAWQWVEDCFKSGYSAETMFGGAYIAPDCGYRVRRGGSWFSSPDRARAASRVAVAQQSRNDVSGFRVARTLAK